MAGGGLIDFQVTLLGEKQVNARLGLALDAVGDLRPAWRAIHGEGGAGGAGGGLIARDHTWPEIMRAQYATQGARGGAPWQGYDDEPRYRGIKIKFGGGLNRILRWREGREWLYPSLTDIHHPMHVWQMTPHTMQVGTSVPHAKGHQLGIGLQKYDQIPLPRRRLIVLTGKDQLAWFRAIELHVQAVVGTRGARVIL